MGTGPACEVMIGDDAAACTSSSSTAGVMTTSGSVIPGIPAVYTVLKGGWGCVSDSSVALSLSNSETVGRCASVDAGVDVDRSFRSGLGGAVCVSADGEGAGVAFLLLLLRLAKMAFKTDFAGPRGLR